MSQGNRRRGRPPARVASSPITLWLPEDLVGGIDRCCVECYGSCGRSALFRLMIEDFLKRHGWERPVPKAAASGMNKAE